MLRLLGEHAAAMVVFTRRPIVRRKAETVRAGLIADLLGELRSTGARELLIESRQAHNDERDRHVIAEAQRSGAAQEDLSYGHGDPRSEPLLWLADALAGAVAADLRRSTTPYLANLPADKLTRRDQGS